jgi:hypothetical protein
MKNTLGKILIISLLSSTLFAGVKAYVDNDTIYSGDAVHYTISADGGDPKFPTINSIGGYSILGVSTSKSVNVINGNYKSTVFKIYSFSPTKSVTIPSYEVSVDGKVYKTDELAIKVVKPTASNSDGDFSISMNIDKNNVFVGEPIKLDVKFKYKLDAKADKITLSPLKMSNFWIKSSGDPVKSTQNDFIIQTYHYLVFPQKQGDFEVSPVEADVGIIKRTRTRGNIFDNPFIDQMAQSIGWKKFLSNTLKIHVKPLPDNLEVIGSFDIKTSVDTIEVKANKPVNLTIKIDGFGNIDDIKKFTIDFDNVVVYSDEPVIKSGINSGKYGGEFTQKIALIADKNFTIPALKFSYFDKNLNKKVTRETKPIFIKVKGSATVVATPTLKSSSVEVAKKVPLPVAQMSVSQSFPNYLYLLFGFMAGVIVTIIYFKINRLKKVKEESSIIKKIQKAKGDRALFEILLPYEENGEFIKAILEKLEENLYSNGKNKISKKEVIEYFYE